MPPPGYQAIERRPESESGRGPSSPELPSRSSRSASVATRAPSTVHNCSADPKLCTGTRYENGFCITVTRRYFPSGPTSTPLIIAGAPTFLVAPPFASMRAS